MSDAEMLIGFGQNDNKVMTGGRSERYKGKKNQTDRVSLCWFYKNEESGEYRMADTDTPKFLMANYHYAPGLGYIAAKGEYTTTKFGPPKRKLGTFIVKYKTDRNGALPKGSDGKAVFDYEVMEWNFGEDKYRLLATIHDEFPLTSHDLKVTCTDDQFQKLSFTACNGNALWQRDERLKKEVLERVAELGAQLSICRDVPIEQIKEHFGEAESVVPNMASDINYDDLMEDID